MGRHSGTLAAIAVLAVGLIAPTAAATPAPSAPQPGTYQNPLDLSLPDGSPVASCADPDVIRAQPPDTHWYLYCTTDPLTEERDDDGNLVFHAIPMFRSDDLIEWEYLGDAFTVRPSWVPENGGLWAPEAVFDG